MRKWRLREAKGSVLNHTAKRSPTFLLIHYRDPNLGSREQHQMLEDEEEGEKWALIAVFPGAGLGHLTLVLGLNLYVYSPINVTFKIEI